MVRRWKKNKSVSEVKEESLVDEVLGELEKQKGKQSLALPFLLIFCLIVMSVKPKKQQ